ncbi:hypothetical protein L210DRAFT_938119, partial [Boletus edulis BED1]
IPELLSGRKSKGDEREKPVKVYVATNRRPSRDSEESTIQRPPQIVVGEGLSTMAHPLPPADAGQQYQTDTRGFRRTCDGGPPDSRQTDNPRTSAGSRRTPCDGVLSSSGKRRTTT